MKTEYLSAQDLKASYPGIYHDLNKCYPIGIKDKGELFYNSQEIMQTSSILLEKIGVEENYTTWEKKMQDDLGNLTKKEFVGATYGITPSLAGCINLYRNDNLKTETNLYFYISLLGNYFSLEIVEFDLQKYVNELQNHGTINVAGANCVTVSPYGLYEDIFCKIELYLRGQYRNYKFLPASFDYLHVRNLFVIQNDIPNNSISNAFFSKIERNNEKTQILGDSNYGDIFS